MVVAPLGTQISRSSRSALLKVVAGCGLLPAAASALVSIAPLGAVSLVAEWSIAGTAAAQGTPLGASVGSTAIGWVDTASTGEPQRFGLVPKTFLINLGGYL